MDQARLLIGDDEEFIRDAYAELLASEGHYVDTAADGDAVLHKLRTGTYDMLVTDLVFPPTDGIAQALKAVPATLS